MFGVAYQTGCLCEASQEQGQLSRQELVRHFLLNFPKEFEQLILEIFQKVLLKKLLFFNFPVFFRYKVGANANWLGEPSQNQCNSERPRLCTSSPRPSMEGKQHIPSATKLHV